MKHVYNVREEDGSVFDFAFQYSDLLKGALVSKLPQAVDLRSAFPPCFDQGQEGSCTGNGWAGVFAFMELMALRLKSSNLDEYEFNASKFVPASRQFIYAEERLHEGTPLTEDNGAMVSSGAWVLQNLGYCDEVVWPYLPTYWQVKPSAAAYAEAAKHKSSSTYTLDSLDQVNQCLVSGYPVVCGIEVYEELEEDGPGSVMETGVLPDPEPDSQYLGGHCVVIVGFDMSKKNYLIRNSWGTSWGPLQGYFWVSFNYLEQYGSSFMSVRA